MSDITKDKRREHIEKRNIVLSELQRIYVNNSDHYSSCSNVDSAKMYVRNRNNGREEMSDCFEEYVADLNFVQSVTWLKAATRSMKNISTEQFYLAFHKQWSNSDDVDKDERCFSIQENANFNDSITPDIEEELSSSTFSDVTKSINNLLAFNSAESLDKYSNTKTDIQRNETFDDHIIPGTVENTVVNQNSNDSVKNYKDNNLSLEYDLSNKSTIEKLALTPLTQICLTQTSQDTFLINSHSLQKDSAYDTYQSTNTEYPLLSKHLQNTDISSFEHIDDIRQDKYSQQSETLLLQDGTRCKENKKRSCCQEIPIKEAKYQGNGRKKLKFTHGLPLHNRNEKGAISSHSLKFMLDTLNADEVAFQSMKTILLVLRNEKIAKQYMRKRCWKNTLEDMAVNEILKFCSVLEADDLTKECTNEIIDTVISLIDNSIKNDELNKVTIVTHQISIILQFCASTNVCIEIINYLIEKLKYHEDILIALQDNAKTDIYDVTYNLHIIFYALKICFEQYRSAVPNKWNQYEEEEVVLPAVTDLWKKQFEVLMVKDNVRQREERWLTILDNFTVNAIDNLVIFAKKSRKLSNFLTHK